MCEKFSSSSRRDEPRGMQIRDGDERSILIRELLASRFAITPSVVRGTVSLRCDDNLCSSPAKEEVAFLALSAFSDLSAFRSAGT